MSDAEEDEGSKIKVSRGLTEAVPQVGRLSSILTCQICYLALVRPVSTPCGHSFCSLCIRQSLQFQQRCPSCFSDTREPQLRPDRTAELLLGEWEGLIRNLENFCVRSNKANKCNNETSPLVDQTNVSRGKENAEPSTLNSEGKGEKEKARHVEEELENPEVQESGPEEADTIMRRNSSSSGLSTAPCSICSVQVSTAFLERHQEQCARLRNSSTAPPSPKPPNSRPQLPKLVYALLKDTDLRKKCKEVGLNHKGDKNILIKRHKRFVLLYNEEREAVRPRPNAVLAAQVAREEQDELSMRQETPSLLQYDKKTDAKEMEAMKKSYLQQNSSTFSQLVAQARARRGSRKPPNNESVKDAHAAEPGEAIQGDGQGEEIEENRNVSKSVGQSLDGTARAGGKRGAGDLTVCAGASSEKRSRSEGSDDQSTVSSTSKDTHSSYFTSNTHVSTTLTTPVKKRNDDSSGGVGKLYVTPTKTHFEELVKKSPKMRNGSIVDVLNRTMSQAKTVVKATCPVCNLQVSEKFLNIHLDKCLRDQESSPVISSSRSKRVPIKKVANPFLVEIDDGDDEELIDVADFLFQSSQGATSQPKAQSSDAAGEKIGNEEKNKQSFSQETNLEPVTVSNFGTDDLFAVLNVPSEKREKDIKSNEGVKEQICGAATADKGEREKTLLYEEEDMFASTPDGETENSEHNLKDKGSTEDVEKGEGGSGGSMALSKIPAVSSSLHEIEKNKGASVSSEGDREKVKKGPSVELGKGGKSNTKSISKSTSMGNKGENKEIWNATELLASGLEVAERAHSSRRFHKRLVPVNRSSRGSQPDLAVPARVTRSLSKTTTS